MCINADSVSGQRSFRHQPYWNDTIRQCVPMQAATSAVVHALELWHCHLDGHGSKCSKSSHTLSAHLACLEVKAQWQRTPEAAGCMLLPIAAANCCCQLLLPVAAASCCCQLLLPIAAGNDQDHDCHCAYLSCACPQGPGWVPLSNLDSRQGPEDPQASKGAAQFFQGLAQQAAQAGVAVDVVAVGQAAVNVPLLGALTQQTGGAIFSHQRKPAQACGSSLQSQTSIATQKRHPYTEI